MEEQLVAAAWPHITLTVTDLAGSHLVVLRGELDAVSADHVFERLVAVAGSTVVVNLGGLSFIDAAGISALVRAKIQVEGQGNSLTMINARGIVRRVFELTDLVHLLDGT